MSIHRLFRIPPGNYDVKNIGTKLRIQLEIDSVIQECTIVFNDNTLKFTFEQKTKYAVAAYSDNTILHMLGLSKQTTKIVTPGKPEVEYIIMEANTAVTSELTPHVKRLSNMFVYSDIVDLSLVGDTQAALLGYLPIQSKFGEQAYWSFNPPYYVHVREKFINTITMQLCTDTGEEFPIEDGKVLCRLNFRRVGLLH